MEVGIIIGIVTWSITSLGLLIGIYVRMQIKLRELDVRVKSLEQTDKAMDQKLDQIIKAIHQIALDLKDKADRP
jgi:hypothetical protein